MSRPEPSDSPVALSYGSRVKKSRFTPGLKHANKSSLVAGLGRNRHVPLDRNDADGARTGDAAALPPGHPTPVGGNAEAVGVGDLEEAARPHIDRADLEVGVAEDDQVGRGPVEVGGDARGGRAVDRSPMPPLAGPTSMAVRLCVTTAIRLPSGEVTAVAYTTG
jgi:hypothetical protein